MPRFRYLAFVLMILLSAACESGSVAGPEVAIKLGGKFCAMYPDAITTALQRVDGVEAVDLESRKGYAIVTGKAGAMKLADLRKAVNGARGEGWHCEAELVE